MTRQPPSFTLFDIINPISLAIGQPSGGKKPADPVLLAHRVDFTFTYTTKDGKSDGDSKLFQTENVLERHARLDSRTDSLPP